MEELNTIINAIHSACTGNRYAAAAAQRAKQDGLRFFRAKKNIPVTVYSWADRWADCPGLDRYAVTRTAVIPAGSCFIVHLASDLIESEYVSSDTAVQKIADFAVLFAKPGWESDSEEIGLDAYLIEKAQDGSCLPEKQRGQRLQNRVLGKKSALRHADRYRVTIPAM